MIIFCLHISYGDLERILVIFSAAAMTGVALLRNMAVWAIRCDIHNLKQN